MNGGFGEAIRDPTTLPDGLPAPVDDGAVDHLPGVHVPDVVLPSTVGEMSLAALAEERLALYIYPRTGRPDRPVPAGWDEVPGARGCTPQSCGFRDHAQELRALGASVAGLSAQPIADQIEFAQRMNMPFPIISDEHLLLAGRLELPTFEFDGSRLYKRLALVAEAGVIAKVFYPVFPPDRNALEVMDWLRERRAG
jgi:peroxiredoxin